MKKSLILLVTAIVFIVLSSACKSYERCPAYGKAEPVSSEERV